jgi:hypothetical protein
MRITTRNYAPRLRLSSVAAVRWSCQIQHDNWIGMMR